MSTHQGDSPHIVIVGAGLAGIMTAIRLKKQLKYENFTIYERATEVGGTWRDNTYPGCGSDVPGHWYSLSTDLNPRWSSYYVSQPEIRAYWEDLYRKYNLQSHTKLGKEVVLGDWDDEAKRYKIVLQDVTTGERTHTEADIMFLAIGGFMNPLYPKDMSGVGKFQGLSWHSAQWRHDVDLSGKRVGVIGNGCSAAQFVPIISSDPSVQVINFCRTPQWYVPQRNFWYPAWVKWLFSKLPFIMRWYRNFLMASADMRFLFFRKDNSLLLALATYVLTLYIKAIAPKDQVKKLVPNYPPGCKRIIVNPGYLEALHRPNVSIQWDAIESVVEEGIKMKTGEVIPLDVIIYATGYSLESADMQIRGRKQTIQEYFASKGGPMAYLGSLMPGFPNAFTILGPNAASGHASVIFVEESQIDMAMRLIKRIIDGKVRAVEVTSEATDKYNGWLQRRLSRSVWMDCNSYYKTGSGGATRVVATFPGPATLFWWLCRRVGDSALRWT